MQTDRKKKRSHWAGVSIGIVLLAGLFAVSRYDFLFFHGIAEVFSIVVAAGIFAFAWHTARFSSSDYFLFLGIGYLAVAFIDVGHMLTYKGMGTPGATTGNTATQLWIAARYLQAATLVAAPIFLRRRIHLALVVLAYAAAVCLLLSSVLLWHIFPECFIEGQGLTRFKVVSEYLIIGALVASLAFLVSRRAEFHPRVFRYIAISILCTVASETAFTAYVSVYGLSNVLGHFLKIYAYYFLYRAIIRTGLREPYNLLFRNLKQGEEALQRAHDQLEIRVAERTLELAEANRALLQEVGARKRAQEALNLERDRLVGILNAMENGVYIVNARYEIEYVNPVIEREFGRVDGRRCYEYFHDRENACPWCSFSQVFAGKTVRWEWYSHKVGKTYDLFDVPLHNADGTVSKLEIFFDISERSRAQVALRESEERYRQMVETAGEGIWTMDEHGTVTFVNRRMAELLGYNVGEMAGRRALDFVSEEDHVLGQVKVGERRRGLTDRYEVRLRHKDGSIVWVLISASPTFVREGHYAGALGMITDITAMKETEKERTLLSAAVHAAAEGIIITTDKGKIEYVNPAFCAMSGYVRDEIIGQALAILESGQEDAMVQQELWSALRRGDVWSGQLMQRRKDGTAFDAEMTVSPIQGSSGRVSNYVAVIRDITEQLRLEGQLRQAQKMEAVGTLAGGIAHDFNNILAAIIGFTEMCLERVTEAVTRRRMEQVLKAGIRGRELVRQILTFSRKSGHERSPVSMRLIVDDTVNLLRASLPSTIEIHCSVTTRSDVVLAEPNQLQQVLMNLSTNAAHAMAGEPGSLTIALSEFSFALPMDAPHPDLKPGTYVRLSVHDTGAGIDRSVLDRIFDPFFTTKKPGEGTGLGLSVVHGIVRGHGGAVTVESEPGKGATFHVFLPRADTTSGDVDALEPKAPVGRERILFVDDEPALVEMGREVLESLGYQVTATTDPLDALRMFREQPDAFDLVITDQAMPHTTGMHLAKELIALRGDLPVILSSGHTDLDREAASRNGIRAVVSKPLTRAETARSIRAVLDALQV